MNARIRLVVIIHGYYPRIGGAERLVGAMAPRLQGMGFDVHVLTRRLPGTRSFERIDGVPVYRLPVPGPKAAASLIFSAAALTRVLSLKPQVIHAHEMFSPATTAIISQALTGAPVVITPHSSGVIGDVERMKRRFLGKQRLGVFRRRVDSFITISKDIDDELAGVGIPIQKRVAIANGVDETRFVPSTYEEKRKLRAVMNLPVDAPLALFCGRLSPEKRVHLLVEVWPKVRLKIPNAHLVLAGTGTEETSLKKMAGEGVVFCGPVDDVSPLMRAADLFCLPSVREGLSVAILESQACALAVAASHIPGNCELIEDGVNGKLFEPDQAEGLGAAICELLSDEGLRHRLGTTGRERVLAKYTLSQTVESHARLYRQLVSQKDLV